MTRLTVVLCLCASACANSPAAPTSPGPPSYMEVTRPLPLARLASDERDIRYDATAGGYEMYAGGVNYGDGCATSVTGVTTLHSGTNVLEYRWSLSPSLLVKPGDTFEYHIGFMGDAEALANAVGTYHTLFQGVTVPCS